MLCPSLNSDMLPPHSLSVPLCARASLALAPLSLPQLPPACKGASQRACARRAAASASHRDAAAARARQSERRWKEVRAAAMPLSRAGSGLLGAARQAGPGRAQVVHRDASLEPGRTSAGACPRETRPGNLWGRAGGGWWGVVGCGGGGCI